jgi:hypothetical protein
MSWPFAPMSTKRSPRSGFTVPAIVTGEALS